MVLDIPVSELSLNRARREAAVQTQPEVVDHLPSELTIAATDRCNLRCVMCGTHHPQQGDNNADKFDFPLELVDKIEGMTAGAERIQLHGGGGEPMMSKSFWKWVSLFSKNQEAQIEFNTNGLLLTPRNIERLMRQRASFICVSLDAASADTYRKIRGGDWARLYRNLVALAKARAEQRVDMRLALNMTVMRDNAHEMPSLIQLAHRLGFDEVQFYKLNEGIAYNWIEQTPAGYVFNYQDNLVERNADYIRPFFDEAVKISAELGVKLDMDHRLPLALVPPAPPQTKNMVPSTVDRKKAPKYSECEAPWRWLNISAGGDVYPCCSAVSRLASLRDLSLAEIWNGEAIQRLRRNIRLNRIDPICQGASCLYVMSEASSAATPPVLRRSWRRLVPIFIKRPARALLNRMMSARLMAGSGHSP